MGEVTGAVARLPEKLPSFLPGAGGAPAVAVVVTPVPPHRPSTSPQTARRRSKGGRHHRTSCNSTEGRRAAHKPPRGARSRGRRVARRAPARRPEREGRHDGLLEQKGKATRRAMRDSRSGRGRRDGRSGRGRGEAEWEWEGEGGGAAAGAERGRKMMWDPPSSRNIYIKVKILNPWNAYILRRRE